MNNTPTVKYELEPEYIQKKSLEPELLRIKLDFHRRGKVKKNNERLKTFGEKLDQRKKLRLRENLSVGKEVLVLAGRLKKKRFTLKTLQKILSK